MRLYNQPQDWDCIPFLKFMSHNRVRIEGNKTWEIIKQACINLEMEDLLTSSKNPSVNTVAFSLASLSIPHSKNNDGGRAEKVR